MTARQMSGPEFRVIRDGLGLPTKWVARVLGVSPRTVARWEAGESWITPEVAREIRNWSKTTEDLVECAVGLAQPGQELLTYTTDADYRAAHPAGRPPYTALWHRLATYRIAATTGLPVTFTPHQEMRAADWTTRCQ
jgi:transcriptional regulator with XRE-family HTH domain